MSEGHRRYHKTKEPQRWGAEALGTLRVLLTDKPAGTIQLYTHNATTLRYVVMVSLR